MLHDLDGPASLRLDPPLRAPGVALVYPDVLETWESLGCSVKEQRYAGTILQVCRVDLRAQDQPLAVDQERRLRALSFLAPS